VPGTLFVGRAGPSVAVLVGSAAAPRVLVGVARGSWLDPGTLRWQVGDPSATLAPPPVGAPSADVDDFLADLRAAVDAAAEAKAALLVTCRYCGALVAPEHALGDQTCHGCGSAVFGIVY
jgi:hypothetical protein